VPAGFLLFTNQFGLLASVSVITTLLPYLGICIAAATFIRGWKARAVAVLGGGTTILILVLAIAL
jgi:hypothetical protein